MNKNRLYTYEEAMKEIEPKIREIVRNHKKKQFDRNAYELVRYNDAKELMDQPGFFEHSILITDPDMVEEYGQSAYYVEKMWLY